MISKNQINNIQKLHLKKNRDLQQLFIAEGEKTVEEILNFKPEIVSEIFATNDFLPSITKLKHSLVSQDELKKISLQSTPNKALAICNYFNAEDKPFDFNQNFSLYLDDVRDPGNFGTILRLANWFGITTIFCSLNTCDFYNPKVIQASMGAFLRVKVEYINLNELINSKNISTIYAAVLNGKNLYKQSLKNGLIVIGNEANGINEENLNLINKPITIPQHQLNGTESLNAAVATAIITGEFYRQLQGVNVN